jgi:hypothetical protein
LAKKLVELHGGQIGVQSRVGQGPRSASPCRFGPNGQVQGSDDLTTAKALGLTIPSSVLARADDVVPSEALR